MSGGKSDDVTVGFKYKGGVHLSLCQDEIDSIEEIIIAERQAWQGSVTQNTTITINKPELFGGDGREGGVVGDVDIMFGGKNQTKNPYLMQFFGNIIPAYRGVTTALFKAFQWASGNPYYKNPWFRVRRIHKGWGTSTPPTEEFLYSPGVMEKWLPDFVSSIDPRNCRNDHEYMALGIPGSNPISHPVVGQRWTTDFGEQKQVLESHLGFGIGSPLIGYNNHYATLHSYGFDDPAVFGDYYGALYIGLNYLSSYVTQFLPARSNASLGANLYAMFLAGQIQLEKPFFWNGNVPVGQFFSLQYPGTYILVRHNVATLNPSFSYPPGYWWNMNNSKWPEVGWLSYRFQHCMRISCRRKVREPDDPCAPWCTPPWPDYEADPAYCDVNGTLVKKIKWNPVTGEFKGLAKYFASSPPNEVQRVPLAPVLPKGHANYSDEAFWTDAYNSAVTLGTLPAGMTYVSTPSTSPNTYPRAMNDVQVWASDEPQTIEGSSAWQDHLAQIGRDMNPAHIIYQCLTNQTWGMGYTSFDIDETSFLNCAQKLFDEQFGLSFEWRDQTTIESFIQMVLNHINGKLTMHLPTAKFMLSLIRDDVDPGSLIELNRSNILELKSVERGVYGDAANELVVTYRDRNQDTKSVAHQNLAAIQVQGAIISATRDYEGIHEDALASRVCLRDLAVMSSNLLKVSCTTNRILWDKAEGDAVALTWPEPIGMTMGVFRIVKINKGNLISGKIDVELVEDVWGLPTNIYTSAPEPDSVDAAVDPQPAYSAVAMEAPYWDVVNNTTVSVRDAFLPGYGFASLLALRAIVDHPFNYKLVYSPTEEGNYVDKGTGYLNPGGILRAALSYVDTVMYLDQFYDLDQVAVGTYLVIENELCVVESVDAALGRIVIGRGVLDTVPNAHVENVSVYFVPLSGTYDTTERIDGETAYYKVLPTAGLGTLDQAAASSLELIFNNRASRPYPPGKFLLNDIPYPDMINDGALTVSWAHRDRLAQTVGLVATTVGNIGPEEGTTYTLRISNADTDAELVLFTGLTGTSQAISPIGGTFNMRIQLKSVRDGLDSWQEHDYVVYYLNSNFRITEDGVVRITETDDPRITED